MYTKQQQDVIKYTCEKVRDLFTGYTVPAHGIDHVARVAASARLIATKEKADIFLSEMSGWLHDIGRTVERHTNLISEHHELSYDLLRKWFKEDVFLRENLTKQQKLVILYAVRYHWNDAANKYPVAWILRDADKLDTFGVIGIKRACQFCVGDDRKLEFDLRARFNNFYWLQTKTARKIVKDKKLLETVESFYVKCLKKKIKPVEL